MSIFCHTVLLGLLVFFFFLDPLIATAGITGSNVKSDAPGHGLQPRNKNISICFVGDALTSRPARVQEISQIIRSEFEGAANIHFTGFDHANNTFPSCALPQSGTCNGTPCHFWYPEDIRIAIDNTTDGGIPIPRQIPATDTECVDRGAPSSWGVSPWNVDKPDYRACKYNVFIGDDKDTSYTPPKFWRNHVLHEVGHALGMIHEFAQEDYFNYRGPSGVICPNSTSQPAAAANPDGFVSLTPVDSSSVMMYQQLSCGIPGNYAHNGLSSFDRLSLHILYPEDDLIAEYVGTTVVKTNDDIRLTSTLALRGAKLNSTISEMRWDIDGQVSTIAFIDLKWTTPGTKRGIFTYTDFVGRHFSTDIEMRVLKPDVYNKIVGGTNAALGLLL